MIEIYLFLLVGGTIGILPTILLVLLTAVLGSILLQQQGIATLQRVQQALERGEVPTNALLEGLIIVVGGVLLLTPGFFTDFLGLLCLTPLSRQLLIAWVAQRMVVQTHQQHGNVTIEGEYRRSDDEFK